MQAYACLDRDGLRSTHAQQNIDGTDQRPKSSEHKVERIASSTSHAGRDHCRNAHRNTAADDATTQEAVGFAEHHKRKKREPLQSLEPGESVPCGAPLEYLRPRAFLDLFEIVSLIGVRSRVTATLHVVRSSRLR
jgi:hypothetical protein